MIKRCIYIGPDTEFLHYGMTGEIIPWTGSFVADAYRGGDYQMFKVNPEHLYFPKA